MILTKKKAIGYAIELWTELVETGEKRKDRCSFWDTHEGMQIQCPLCEYGDRKATRVGATACDYCPYCKVFGECLSEDYEEPKPYDNWMGAKTVEERKKYAGLFLEQLKQLR